jgi:hypothetical protein
VAAGPHDDGNGKAKDEDDALTVPGFGSPALVAGASGGDAWWNSVDTARTAEWVPVRTTTSCLDSVKAKYLGSVMAAAGSEAKGGRSGFMANGGGRPNGTSMSSATAVDGQEPHGRQKVDGWAYLWDGDGRDHGGAGSGHGPQWNGLSGVRWGGCY